MSYKSQWQQDKWLNENIFKNKKNGFFVDVGAHDGVEINNTYYFENKLNWKGICIEPLPHIFKKLKKNRNSKNCVCLEGCVYNKDGIVEFNSIDGYSEMLSGIKEAYCNQHIQRINTEVEKYGGKLKTLQVPSFRLETIFDLYGIKKVDYLSIDTEGSELQVLHSINFNKVNFNVIEVEVNYPQDEIKIKKFLEGKGYKFKAKLGGDIIYTK